MEKDLKNTWKEIIINLTKNWILQHEDFCTINMLASEYIAVVPNIDIDICIEYNVYNIISNSRAEFLSICSFNDRSHVTETMKNRCVSLRKLNQYSDVNEYTSSVLLKENKFYILPKAAVLNFMPGTVKLVYEIDLPDFKERDENKFKSTTALLIEDAYNSPMVKTYVMDNFSTIGKLEEQYAYPGF